MSRACRALAAVIVTIATCAFGIPFGSSTAAYGYDGTRTMSDAGGSDATKPLPEGAVPGRAAFGERGPSAYDYRAQPTRASARPNEYRLAPNTAGRAGVRGLANAGDDLAQGGVYALRDPVTGQVVRTGRTNNLLRRQGEHFRDSRLSDFEFEVVARTDVYAQQRGLEQFLHDAYNPALNRLNPISASHPNRGWYLSEAERFLARYGGG